MDLEALQILNLSPIPELSEIELSTMLDQLSGLSDVNGDLTDRNVEDILKEAEDLLDRSTSSKTHESRSSNKSLEAEKHKLIEINEDKNVLKDEEQNSQSSNLEKSKHFTVSVNNSPVDVLSEDEANKHCNSPSENSSIVLCSPGSSSNHIKSTIDSLKEFSIFIEKKLASQTPKSSPTQTEKKKHQNESSDNNAPKQVPDNLKVDYIPELIAKKELSKPLDKSIKLLNCFERLYRDKPVRLTCKKPKVVDKVPKTIIKKKLSKDLKNNKKNNWQSKTIEKKIMEDDGKMCQVTSQSLQKPETGDLLKPNKMTSKNYFLNNQKYFLQTKVSEKDAEDEFMPKRCWGDNLQCDNKFVQARTDEKQMQIGLEEVEKIKNKVKKDSIFSDGENLENIPNGEEKVIGIKKSEGILQTEKSQQDSDLNSGIKRLEEQFFVLTEKYNYQMEKLEAENFRLKEALSNQQKAFTSQEFLKIGSGGAKTESVFNLPSFFIPEKKISQSVSLENCKAPKNSPCSSPENVETSATVKEAFSQTEKDLKNTSIQCSQESREVGTNSNTEIISETKKTENKENFVSKKKFVRSRPFSDLNVHHSMRQKKALEHETQLMATLRGLQAEVTVKDKENRKLKNEIDSLKKQIKKLGNVKVENCRRCNIGTQTIGLGPFVQKPYNPENYEVPLEFEKENEDLRQRIKALEEDFELLKEKRITDLQSLHQVHEEEMAKLVSKLETQSALTRHLHSLLVNR